MRNKSHPYTYRNSDERTSGLLIRLSVKASGPSDEGSVERRPIKDMTRVPKGEGPGYSVRKLSVNLRCKGVGREAAIPWGIVGSFC
jgi:hypothetical protein